MVKIIEPIMGSIMATLNNPILTPGIPNENLLFPKNDLNILTEEEVVS